ncbi:uncharacterized protein METZ01_LOCUS247974 [marine metagenome]|uniref:Uncharacterized protein n=1 Tax=marine metagenome TaxID=408172 RepID=A0A382I643_9ZZZZ
MSSYTRLWSSLQCVREIFQNRVTPASMVVFCY